MVNWVNTFHGVEVRGLDELSDGVVLYEILREIAPSHFGEGVLKDNCGSNAILKTTNVKKLLRFLESYYKEVLMQDIDMDMVDAAKVAQAQSVEVSKLVELVLGCAVQCDDKHRYIERVMKDLDKQSQADLMILTKQCLSRGERHALDQSEVLDVTAESEGAVSGQVSELQEAVRRLQLKVDDLECDKLHLQEALQKAEASKAELEHDLTDALEQRGKYEKLYNDVLEENIESSARHSTQVWSD